MTFFGQWSEVQSEICFKAMEQMYCAPGKNKHDCKLKPEVVPWCNLPPSGKIHLVHRILEKTLFWNIKKLIQLNSTHCVLAEIGGVSRVTEACDWWSLGALLFELLTGMVTIQACSVCNTVILHHPC